jgi:aspartate kinase
MGIIVQKYGGSSVADVEKLERVAEKVANAKRAGDDVVVVVSAMGKSTDQLLALAKQIDPNPPRRELDMLLTTGERVSMALLAMAIQKRGFEAISFTGSQSGIITNDRHFDARIIEVKPHRIEDELARGKIVIVAGYQGMSYRREITTLGRGGSDTTAIALAAALNATRAEIYSDVDGVYSADPRVVPEAQHIATLSYDTMQEMADVGAKVLNAAAVEFAKKQGIAIHARSTFEPGRESIVVSAAASERSVVGQKGVCRLHTSTPEAFAFATRTLGAASVPMRDVELNGTRGSMTLATGLTPDWAAIRASLLREDLTLEENLASASVVGVDASQAGEVIAVAQALQLSTLSLSANALRVSLLVEESQLDALVRALHARFVETKPA